jgi:hypothetical protein
VVNKVRGTISGRHAERIGDKMYRGFWYDKPKGRDRLEGLVIEDNIKIRVK